RERGLSDTEARYAARREFGVLGPLQEQGRDARGARWAQVLRRDARASWRALGRNPAFTVVAVLSLALGVGANTAIFSLIDAVVMKALPVERPSELAIVMTRDRTTEPGRGSSEMTNPIWEAIRDHLSAFASFAVAGPTQFDIANGGEARLINATWVNGDFFNALGVRAEAGRLLSGADDYRGCPAVAAISDGFWRGELGGRADAIGRTISLNAHPFVVIGVTPPEFFGIEVGATAQV